MLWQATVNASAQAFTINSVLYRAKQLGQRQVTAAVEGNVMGRELVEAEIAALGNQAEAAGLTTQQVLHQPHQACRCSALPLYRAALMLAG